MRGVQYRLIVDHGLYESTGLHGARANRLRPALSKQTGHGSLVSQAELPLILKQHKNTHKTADIIYCIKYLLFRVFYMFCYVLRTYFCLKLIPRVLVLCRVRPQDASFKTQWINALIAQEFFAHPEVGELQGDLDEGVRTGLTLLDQAFPKILEGNDVGVDVVGQGLSHWQRVGDHRLALRKKKREEHAGEKENTLTSNHRFKTTN